MDGNGGRPDGRQDWERELEALGKSLRGLADSVSENIGPALKSAGQAAARGLRTGLDAAGQAVRESTAPQRAEKRRAKRLKKLRERYEALKGTALGLGITSFVFLAIAAMDFVESGAPDATLLVLAAAFAIPAAICQWRSYAAGRLAAYHRALDGRSSCRMEELAAAVNRSVPATAREVGRMASEGAFEEMYLAPDKSRLFTSRAAYGAYLAACEARRETAAEREEQAAPAGGGEAQGDGAPAGAQRALEQFLDGLAAERAKLADAQMDERVQRMAAQTRALIEWLRAHPQDEAAVKRFTGYYLPTALKLLRTYNEVGAQEGGAASQIRRDVAGLLDTVNEAFGRLRDGLLQDTAMDVSAEIAAMETVLTQDGLRGDGLMDGLR